ncbi:MAG TPA: S41 family peptidase [Candidatus Tumulicola sp.]|nr:S41 family peptidase [Candidatus Tumulicola sp.]
MPISRLVWLTGSLGFTAVGLTALSLPGGGPRSFFGGQPPQRDFAPPNTLFSPNELRTELAWLVDTMREVGANPFAYCAPQTFESRYAQTVADLSRPLDARGFFLRISPLFAALNDGHVSINLGHTFETWADGGGKAFPLLLTFDGDEMYVETPTDETLEKGARIESVDGVPGQEIIKSLTALQGAQTPLLRTAMAPALMRQFYYARYGERPSFEVVAHSAGRRFAQRISALQYDVLAPRMNSRASNPYTFSRIDGRVGYINYRQCSDLKRFKAFLKTTFTDIAREPVDGLVVDIRENTGGDSTLNAELWKYLTSKAFSDGSPVTMKVSSRIKREYGFFRYNLQYFPPAWFMRDGSLLTQDYTWIATIRPGANPLRYDGPVYLLVGTKTFSSALDCAQEAKDYKLATLVGQETGEPLDTTGTAYGGYSPRIGTRFQFTTRYSWFPDHPKGRGVIPDVTIAPTQEDISSGYDPVLAYALSQISTHARRKT